MIFFIGLIIGYIFIIFYEYCFEFIKKRNNKEPIVRCKGYHLHHSLYGLIFIVLFLIFQKFYLLGIGLGIIIRHTQAEKKFIFIDKS